MKVSASIIVIASVLAGHAAHAQQAGESPRAEGSAEAHSSSAGVEDIVVTAQKRSENVQNVPIAISAYSSEALRDNNIKTLNDIGSATPGLTFGQTGSDPRPSMRGVPTPTIQVDGDPSLGFHIDGVYQPRTISASVAVFDLERLEVQRGPQGTLNGRNTTGGNISIATQGPKGEFGGYVRAGVGNYDAYTVEAALNVPLNDTLAVRLAGIHRKHDFYARNDFNPKLGANAEDLYAGRASVKWSPSSDFTAIARFSIARDNAAKSGFLGYKVRGTVLGPDGLGAIDGTVDLTINPLAPGAVNDPERGHFSSDTGYFADLKTENASLNLEWRFGDVRLASITGYNHVNALRGGEFDFSELNQQSISYRVNTKYYSQELHLSSVDTQPLQWIIGGFVSQEQGHEDFDYTFEPGFPVPALRGPLIVRDTDINYKSIAAFGQASYYVLPKFRLTAGGRYTKDTKTFSILERARDSSGTSPTFGTVLTTLNQSKTRSFSKFTWKVGADYFATDANMLYATFATGFRSGGFNRVTGANPLQPLSFQPETVKAYEIGSKNRFLDNTLQLNVAAFWADYDNAQISQFVGGGTSVTNNAGKVRAKGVEFEMVARPVPAMHFTLSGQYLDAKYRTFKNCVIGLVAPPANINDCSGNRIERSPEWKVSLGAAYDFDLGSMGTLTPRIASTLTDDYYNIFSNTQIDKQKSFTKTDLRLVWKSVNEKISLEAYVENLENVRPILFGVTQYQAGQRRGAVPVTYGNPRTYGVRAGFDF